MTFSVVEGAWNTFPVCCAQQFPHLLSHPLSQFLLDEVFVEAEKGQNTKNAALNIESHAPRSNKHAIISGLRRRNVSV